jgi:hypothetical protein
LKCSPDANDDRRAIPLQAPFLPYPIHAFFAGGALVGEEILQNLQAGFVDENQKTGCFLLPTGPAVP